MTSGDWQRQDVRLARRLGGDIYERCVFHRGRLDRSGLGRRGVQHRKDLLRLAPMGMDDVPQASTLLLHPTDLRVVRSRGGRSRHRYWPVQWTLANGVPLAYSAQDLRTLAALGSRMFEMAGVGPLDVVADVTPPMHARDRLQVALGLHRSRISSMTFAPGTPVVDVDLLMPTVVVGTVSELVRLLIVDCAPGQLQRVHTAMVVGPPPTDQELAVLQERFQGDGAAVVQVWAPQGVLAAWTQCRGGTGFHTSDVDEVLEIVDPLTGLPVPKGQGGTLLWTGIGWFASAVVRLRVDTVVRALPGMCMACGRSSLRIERSSQCPTLADVLNASPQVQTWFAEMQRRVDGDQVAVWALPSAGSSSLDVLSIVSRQVGEAEVHMADAEEIARRVEAAKGERFVDRRALPLDAEG